MLAGKCNIVSPFVSSICEKNGEDHRSTLNRVFAENVCRLTEVKFNFDGIYVYPIWWSHTFTTETR